MIGGYALLGFTVSIGGYVTAVMIVDNNEGGMARFAAISFFFFFAKYSRTPIKRPPSGKGQVAA